MLVLQKITRSLSIHLIRRSSSSVVTPAAKSTIDQQQENHQKPKHNLVSAAFESLKDDSGSTLKIDPVNSKDAVDNKDIDLKISGAKTVNGLLSVTDTHGPVSRNHALKVVSILAEWSSIKRVQLSDFESDSRFIKLCRVLGRAVPKNTQNNNHNHATDSNKKTSSFRNDDLNMVLGVAGDDEAAKLIASISIPQMVKVLTTLSQKKRRSTPLLRSLAFNISSSSEPLNLKQSADILYSMATLNFPDSVLSAKLCADIQTALPSNTEKSAVVGSILTSLGILKYRDLDVLEALTNWILKNNEISRPQDISALLLTLATLNFQSEKVDEIQTKLVKSLVEQDFIKPCDWLNHVWALTLLQFSNSEHVESVLNKGFIEQIENSSAGLSPNAKMKLLNINGYAKLMLKSYSGPVLTDDSIVFSVPLAHNKSKQSFLNGMLDAFRTLLSSPGFIATAVDSKMGFLIDCVCAFDSKRNPLALDKNLQNGKKIAVMAVDFHDICHGSHRSLSGITSFSFNLLEKSGYHILNVPYNEFNTNDKLLKRAKYLENKIKEICK